MSPPASSSLAVAPPGQPESLTPSELERRVREAVPGVLFVEEHIIRRAVREERGITGLRALVPHTHCAAVPREALTRIASAGDLGQELPPDEWLLLLVRPDAHAVEDAEVGEVLRRYWQTLFHASLDKALMSEARAGRLGRVRMLGIFDQLGQLPVDEARTVLAEEGLTGIGSDAALELIELVSTWHELHFFAPEQLARWFPSLNGRTEVQAVFDALVPAAEILAQTRPEGALDPIAARAPTRAADRESRDVGTASEAADMVEQRAAASLGGRLRALVSAPSDTAEEWAAALLPLMPRARRGMAHVEARLLHDLQKACLSAERMTWDIDLGRWLRSFGGQPLRRKEGIRSQVEVVRSLARALARLPLCHIDEDERRGLKRLLGALVDRATAHCRQIVGAILAAGLGVAGLAPRDVPERVAHDKLVAELLDKLLERGFIGFSDLRDQIAQNQLKLADVRNAGEWIAGDALLALDRYYADHLDGAYRRGEVYRRGFQRLSALLFANRLGRFLVRFLLLPFGGSFFLVQGLEHILGPLIGLFAPAPVQPHGAHHTYFWSLPSFLVTGIVLFALLHSRVARQAASACFRGLGRVLRFFFAELPRHLRAWAPIDRLVSTYAFEVFWNRLFRPARYALVPTLLVVLATDDARWWAFAGLPLTLLFGFFLASRRGLRFSEALGDGAISAWYHLKRELLPGLVALTFAFFKRLMELAEIALYQVDQWLRFRRGDSMLGVALKSVFGFLWGIFAYLLRFMVNLVIEPQVNPIKHFPVVTVSHKLTIPTTLFIAHELKAYVGVAAANIIGGLAQLIIPGVCGFLVWEFKENWRLYRANRAPKLRPVVVGAHGEPVHRLLRLGFHSGTVPRIFRKLRNAEAKHHAVEIRKQLEALHHVEEALRRWIERELVALLTLSQRFPAAEHLRVGMIRLTPARIAIDLGCAPLGEPLQLTFEEQARFLVAGLVQKGFLRNVAPEPKAAFEVALAGLYMLAGVDLVREHIEAVLPGAAGETRYDIDSRGLVVWPAGFCGEVVYRLRTRAPVLVPVVSGLAHLVAPAIAAGDLDFKARTFSWQAWAELWSPPNGEVEAAPDVTS